MTGFFKLMVIFGLLLSFVVVYADTLVTAYQLWLEITEKPEKVKVGLLVKDDYGLRPECEDCEFCDGDVENDDDTCLECEESGCEYPYGYVDHNEVAGNVYRGKFDESDKLSEVVKINFDDYFDECVAPGKYEYILYETFPFQHCSEEVSHYDGHSPECRNNASITVPQHSETCPEHQKVNMTQDEFNSMIFSLDDDVTSDEDSEVSDSDHEIQDEAIVETPDEEAPDEAVKVDDSSQETSDPDQVPDASNVDTEVYDDNYHDCGTSDSACSVILI